MCGGWNSKSELWVLFGLSFHHTVADTIIETKTQVPPPVPDHVVLDNYGFYIDLETSGLELEVGPRLEFLFNNNYSCHCTCTYVHVVSYTV